MTMKAEDPMLAFVERLMGFKNPIERSEKRGQLRLIASEVLPKNAQPSREHYKNLGFVFGDEVDELFMEARLPEGWTKRPSDHSMWSYIFDHQGRKRAGVFYKAAFYDRKAYMHLIPRFSVGEKVGEDGVRTMGVLDGDTIIHVVGRYDPLTDAKVFSDGSIATSFEMWWDRADAYLDERYPEWRDVTKYWSLPPGGKNE